ncbi:Enoyl reductase LovC [Apiospora hydei]|uniref:Enoyl reductase LovC n=1 Tax=Apiospora hydei TaxID=1337664 RepID=A0ABR1WXU7_9PEZI
MAFSTSKANWSFPCTLPRPELFWLEPVKTAYVAHTYQKQDTSPNEQLVYNPSIWSPQINPPPGLGNAAQANPPPPGLGNAYQVNPSPGLGNGYQVSSRPGLGNATQINPPPGFGDFNVAGGQSQRSGNYPGVGNVGYPAPNDIWRPRPEPSNFVQQYPEATNPTGQYPERLNNWQQYPGSNAGMNQPPVSSAVGQPRELSGFTGQQPRANNTVGYRHGKNAVGQQRRAAYPLEQQSIRTQAAPATSPLEYDPNFTFSENYKGSRLSRSNFSANVSDQENCSVFIRGLPPTCTPDMLLRNIRGCGTKVFALHINEPDRKNPDHCAAKLVFFEPHGVDWLWEQIEAGTFIVADENGVEYKPNACPNKIRSAPISSEDQRTRVLLISGPASVVSAESLNRFFKANFRYEVDCVYTAYEDPNWRAMEFHFSSARNQCDNAVKALNRLAFSGPGPFGP